MIFLKKEKCTLPKNRTCLRDFARPSAPDRHRARNLPRPDHQIMFEITEPEQKQPNSFQNALHKDHSKRALVKFTTSIWGKKSSYITKRRVTRQLR